MMDASSGPAITDLSLGVQGQGSPHLAPVDPPRQPDRERPKGATPTMARKSGGPPNPWHGHFEPKRVPEGIWMRCDHCGATLIRKQVIENLNVCPECNHHFTVSAVERIAQILDPDTFEEWFADLRPGDPLEFNDRRPYPERLKAEQERTGLNEAAIVGQGFIKGIRIVFGVTDSSFIMGSMGSVVGEKLTRAMEEATRQCLPIIIVSGSGGGARMHEGILSLMQMAKVSQAIARHHLSGGLYISVLTHPTMGGVAASFASLGDIILAEPKALIGFAGPKVIQQTVRVQLPEGFQTSEFLLEHGFLDRIVQRKDLRSLLAQLIDYVSP
jgi:acetyl-CoA carboxylase carboxyl transferase subunit beta